MRQNYCQKSGIKCRSKRKDERLRDPVRKSAEMHKIMGLLTAP